MWYTCNVFVPSDGEVVIKDAVMAGNGWIPANRHGTPCSQSWEKVNDAAGEGIRVCFTMSLPSTAVPEFLFSYTLYDGDGAIRMGYGMKNTRDIGLRLMRAEPLSNGELILKLEKPLTLNGGAGAETTRILNGLDRTSPNSLMLTGLSHGKRRTLVWGGLANREYGKWFSVGTLLRGSKGTFLSMRADDPVGRLVDPGQTYWAADTFYLNVTTDDPFAALEKYGRAMPRPTTPTPSRMISRCSAAGPLRFLADTRTSTTPSFWSRNSTRLTPVA